MGQAIGQLDLAEEGVFETCERSSSHDVGGFLRAAFAHVDPNAKHKSSSEALVTSSMTGFSKSVWRGWFARRR